MANNQNDDTGILSGVLNHPLAMEALLVSLENKQTGCPICLLRLVNWARDSFSPNSRLLDPFQKRGLLLKVQPTNESTHRPICGVIGNPCEP